MVLRQMAKNRLLALSTSLLVGLFFVTLPVSRLRAVTPTATGSITVSPAIINLVLPSGQQDASTSLTVTNNYNKTVRLSAEWQSIDEVTGRLIPSGPLNPVLADSLRISETDLSIAPQSSKIITVAVHNTPALAPGGHYAILLFTVVSEGKEKLGLQSALSVTAFIVKRDGAKTEISLNNLSAPHNLFSLPRKGTITLTNTGNVHVTPHAAVTVEHKGEVIAKAIVNEASSPLLPGKKAVYKISFVKLKNMYWPAKLELRTVYRVDQSSEIHEQLTHFLYIPPFWAFLIIGLGIALYFVIKKGWSLLVRVHKRLQRIRKQRKSSATDMNAHEEPVPSKITVSSVEISPSHAVPVERTNHTEKTTKTTNKLTKKSSAKKSTKKKS